MPLATLSGNPPVVENRERMRRVAEMVRIIVALNLDCSDLGGNLTDDDIDVEVCATGPMDIKKLDLVLTVLANDFPSRKENLKERKDNVAKAFQTILRSEGFSGISVGVWIVLLPAEWADFTL